MHKYYPFGWAMPGRQFTGEEYRYSFNGKEDDKDWGKQLIQDYGFRLYNPSIAKFLSVDPLSP
ncbi:MAG: RHS repeat-associated core domain-containing protein, partial [Saprospiraceae bacterium]